MKVVIMQGVPGSGKSHHVRTEMVGAHVVSADHFFERLGRFDGSLLQKAHNECLWRYTHTLMDATKLVVVDNTNTTQWEIAPYYQLALAFGYDVNIVSVECDPNVAFHRGTHGVPLNKVMDMHNKIKDFVPPRHWRVMKVNGEA